MAGIGVVTHDSSIDNLLTGTFPSPEHYLRTFSRLGKLPVENENIPKTDTLGQFFQPGVLPQAFLQFPQIINSMLQSNKLFKAYFHFKFVLNFCCILILEVSLGTSWTDTAWPFSSQAESSPARCQLLR